MTKQSIKLDNHNLPVNYTLLCILLRYSIMWISTRSANATNSQPKNISDKYQPELCNACEPTLPNKVKPNQEGDSFCELLFFFWNINRSIRTLSTLSYASIKKQRFNEYSNLHTKYTPCVSAENLLPNYSHYLHLILETNPKSKKCILNVTRD